MTKKESRIGFRAKPLVLVLILLIGVVGPASADRIPRILLAGDSWTGFLLAFRTFKNVLPEYPGLERWLEVGNRTAEMGARVFEMIERNYQQVLTEELTKYPNVDVVVMTLGGNDILRGTVGVDPTNYYREVELEDCYRYPDGPPWDTATECMDWLALSVKEKVGILVDHILSVRPDIRVVILSYDYGAREPEGSYTVEEMHLSFVAVQERMRELALERDRVEFVMNFGLMQHMFGVPMGDYPEDGYPSEDIPPGVAPYPCNDPAAPECTFWPGGYPQYLSPMASYIDQDIHLTAEGYAHVARRAIGLHIEEWLNYPKALEILPLSNKATYQFQVTFTHPVTGVDVSDFEVYINTKAGLKAMDVVNVEPASGPADVYMVTVDMGSSLEAAQIKVLDDDSILRADTGVALGGPGAGNGLFVYNGTYEFQDIPQATDEDFSGSMQFLYMASQAYEHLLSEYGFSFNPDHFDANGNFTQDGSIDDPYIIPGNGMLDLYEFMVIDAILKRPDLDLSATGGLTYQDVRTAWDLNIASVQTALGGVGGLADIILPGIDTVLAGFYTLGDNYSTFLVSTLVMLLDTIEEFPTNTDPTALTPFDISNTTQFLSRFLAFFGDADGDTWRNFQEYAYFAPDGMAAYVNATLDPNLTPKTGEGNYRAGDFVRIPLLDRAWYKSTFQWFRDGQPIMNDKDGHVSGADTPALDILAAQPGDSGNYTCVYQGPTKVGGVYPEKTYGPIKISVREVGVMPAGGFAALSILAVTMGLGSAWMIRRKR